MESSKITLIQENPVQFYKNNNVYSTSEYSEEVYIEVISRQVTSIFLSGQLNINENENVLNNQFWDHNLLYLYNQEET